MILGFSCKTDFNFSSCGLYIYSFGIIPPQHVTTVRAEQSESVFAAVGAFLHANLSIPPSLADVWRSLELSSAERQLTLVEADPSGREPAVPPFAAPRNHADRIGPGSRKTVGIGSCQQQLRLTTCKYMQMKRSSHDTCTQEEWTVPFPAEDSGWRVHCPTHTLKHTHTLALIYTKGHTITLHCFRAP